MVVEKELSTLIEKNIEILSKKLKNIVIAFLSFIQIKL